MTLSSSRGIALVTVLLVSSLVFTMALGLSLVVSVNQLVVRNHAESAALAAAARAGVELAAHELADADWNAVLTGLVQASGSDGAPTGPRVINGARTLDLSVQTNLLNCASPAGCSDGEMQARNSRPALGREQSAVAIVSLRAAGQPRPAALGSSHLSPRLGRGRRAGGGWRA